MPRCTCLQGSILASGDHSHWYVPALHCEQCNVKPCPYSLKCVVTLLHATGAICFCLVLACSELSILPKTSATHNPFTAMRVGEAANPGPDLSMTWAITNPTSIVSKAQQYQQLIQKHGLDFISASETAATQRVQRQFSAAMRTLGFRSKWATPLPDRVERSDLQPSLRGKASGVAMFARWPIRHLMDTISPETQASARLVHLLLDLGNIQIQCIVIYGLAQSNMNKANANLLLEALAAVDCYALPYVILGDFNCNPLALIPEEMQSRRLTDLKMIHMQRKGFPMPPTCRQTTWPDTAVFSPIMAKWITDVDVCPPGDFDTHQVVLFKTKIPVRDLHALHLPLPKTWADLPLNSEHFPDAYNAAVCKLGTPKTLTEWGTAIECAVDAVYKTTQLENGVSPHAVKALPQAYRGRCRPRKPERVSKLLLTKVGRPGDFAARHEVARHSTLRKIKQVRRIQSLHGRLVAAHKNPLFNKWFDLHLEWQAILYSRAIGPVFVAWCQHQPELGPPAQYLPTEDYLYTMLQLLRHDTQIDLAQDQQIHRSRAKFARQLDRKLCGHKQAYAAIREHAMPPLTEVCTQVSEEVITVTHQDGTITAFCHNPQQYDLASPVQLNECQCHVVDIDGFSMRVRPAQALQDVPETCTLTQNRIHADPSQILDILTNYWKPFWHCPHNRPAAKEEFESFLQELPKLMPAPALDLQDDKLWAAAITSLKIPSARGVDGISSSELQQLPPKAITHLKQLLLSFDEGFPADLMLAITVPIPKVADIPTAGQVRPITVLPQLYRLWAKVCTKQILAHYALHMPPDLTGFLKGRGPTEAYLRQQFAIEICHWKNTPLAGLSIDLLKCFNTIAPWAVKLSLEWLGIPPPLITQWYNSLQKLSRIWKLDQMCTPPISTNHGMPEGDSWSVVAILSLAYAWSLQLRRSASQAFVSAYADNWSWGAATAVEHDHILNSTTHFAYMTDMIIDWKKSWTWATSADMHQVLTQVLHTKPYACELVRKLSALDLGAIMTYQGVPHLGRYRERLAKAMKRLDRLESVPLPLSSKIQLTRGSVMPVALYGTEVIPLGEAHVRKLRSAMSNALLGHSNTRNAALALLALPQLLDPQVDIILRSLRALKKLYLSLPPDQQAIFCTIASRHSGMHTKCRGPIGCLVYYLSKLGWSFTSVGHIQVEANIHLPFATTGMPVFAKWAQLAWAQDLLMHHSDRKALRFLRINPWDTCQVLTKFTDSEQRQLAQDMALSFQTETQKSKWAEDATGLCLHCGEPDSREHRIYDCPAAAEVRSKYQDTLTWMQSHGAEFHELPWLLQHENQLLIEHLHYLQPEAAISPAMLEKLNTLSQTFMLTFYTDGALKYPDSRTCRYGAYAIILDTCATNEQRTFQAQLCRDSGLFPVSLVTCATARLQGNQTIYRAELFAVVCVFEWTAQAHVKTDNAAVIQAFQRCHDALFIDQLADMQELDLVHRLWHAMQLGIKQISKIKAHQEVGSHHSDLEVYDILGNRLADEAAGATLTSLQPHLPLLADQMHRDITLEKQYLESFFRLLLDLRIHFALLHANQKEQIVHDNLRMPTAPSPQHVLSTWQVEETWEGPPAGVCFFQYSPWGKVVCNLLLEWMLQVKWPKDPEPQEGDLGATWMELFVSFTLWSKFLLPLKRFKPGGEPYLQTFSDWAEAEKFAVGLGEASNGFTNLLLQVRKLCTNDVWPDRKRGFCKSLYVLGSSNQPFGFLQRPVMPMQSEVTEYMHAYVMKFQAFDKLPPLDVVLRLPAGMQLTLSWQKSLKEVAKGYQIAKQWRQHPLPGIRF